MPAEDGSRPHVRQRLVRLRPSCALVASALAFCSQVALLGSPSYWKDEAATLSATRRSFNGLTQLLHHVDVVHGVYYVFLHAWILLGGSSEWWTRLPSCVAYAWLVGVVASLAQKTGGVLGAWVAAVVAALLPSLSWLAVDARSTPFATLLVALSVWALRRGARSAPWWSALLLYCAVLVQVTALLMVPVWLLMSWRRSGWRAAVPPMVLVGVLAAPFAVFARTQAGQISFVKSTAARDLVKTVVLQPVYAAHSTNLGTLYAVLIGLIALLVPALVVTYWLVLRDLELIAWAYGPGVLAALLNAVGIHVYLYRYFTYSIPAFALMAGALAHRALAGGPARAGGGRTRVALGLGALFVAACVPLWVDQHSATGHWGDDLRSDGRFLASRGAATIVYASASGRAIAEAYPRAVDHARQVPAAGSERADGSLWGPQLSQGQVVAAVHRYRDVVVVGTTELAWLPRLPKTAHCSLVDQRHGPRFRLLHLACP